jgi:D-tyrosyl-tRNA(Tyr) deacylase
MKAIIQRVRSGRVSVSDCTVAEITGGVVILLGIGHGDGVDEIDYLVNKIANLRIFEDDQGKMNLSLLEVGGSAIVVSQFTLYADTSRGRRPSFVNAAPPDIASPLVDRFITALNDAGVPTQGGEFAAYMQVELVNDGPVTIILDR